MCDLNPKQEKLAPDFQCGGYDCGPGSWRAATCSRRSRLRRRLSTRPRCPSTRWTIQPTPRPRPPTPRPPATETSSAVPGHGDQQPPIFPSLKFKAMGLFTLFQVHKIYLYTKYILHILIILSFYWSRALHCNISQVNINTVVLELTGAGASRYVESKREKKWGTKVMYL